MEKFWKALETELCARGLKSSGYYGVNTAGNFQIEKTHTPVKGVRPFSVTGRFIEIKPAGSHLEHVMDIDETWIGYDNEGCHWSDNMGGVRIDCNGLNYTGAIKRIANVLFERFPEYFV